VFFSTCYVKNDRELESKAAASKKNDAGEYDVVVRQLQFEMKAKASYAIFCIFYRYDLQIVVDIRKSR